MHKGGLGVTANRCAFADSVFIFDSKTNNSFIGSDVARKHANSWSVRDALLSSSACHR